MSWLCLKDEIVLTLKDVNGVPAEILKINNPELLPIILKNNCTFENLMDWLSKRGIPDKREGLSQVVQMFGDSWLKNKNYASLTDHYWIKMRTESYKKINFFTNLYSQDVGDMFFKPWDIKKRKLNFVSPDLTTNGLLKKRWLQDLESKKSFLIKAGSEKTKQEPLSEVLVSVLTEKINKIDCVKYDLHIEGATMCSICDSFITENTMLVPAYYIYRYEKRADNEGILEHLLKMCEKFQIPNAEEHIRWTLFIDSLTGNDDRNLGNIGFLLDINTMKFIGPAPMYDSGNAYWSSNNIGENKSKLFTDKEFNFLGSPKEKNDILNFLTQDKSYIYGYEKLIRSYPCITDIKKENLIEAIKKRNVRLFHENNKNFYMNR